MDEGKKIETEKKIDEIAVKIDEKASKIDDLLEKSKTEKTIEDGEQMQRIENLYENIQKPDFGKSDADSNKDDLLISQADVKVAPDTSIQNDVNFNSVSE